MSNFINNIANRHMQPANSIQPRLRGRFEPPGQPPAGEPESVESFPLSMPVDPATATPTDPSSQKISGQTGRQDHLPENIITVKQAIPADTSSPEKAKQETAPPLMPAAATIPPLTPLHDSRAEKTAEPRHNTLQPVVLPLHNTDNGNGHTQITMPSLQTPLPEMEYVRHHEAPKLAEEARSWLRGSPSDEPRRREAADHQPAAPPVIQVSIGRIDVRAVTPPAPAKTPPNPTPVMSLDEFLKRKK